MANVRLPLLALILASTACGGRARTPAAEPQRTTPEPPRLAPQEEPGERISENEFRDRVVKLARNDSGRAVSEQALLEGDVARSEQILIESYPPDDLISRFFLANMLFSEAPATSMEHHREVARVAGHVSFVALEWGMQLHRAGRCKEALGPYRQALSSPSLKKVAPLVAHCLLATGRAREAASLVAEIPGNRDADQLFKSLYGPTGAWRRRAALLQKERPPEARWTAVVLYDLEFPVAPAVAAPQPRALAFDLARLRQELPADSRRRQDLEALILWRSGEWTSRQIAEYAGRYASGLPAHTGIARMMADALVSTDTVDARDLWRASGETLLSAARRGDRDALRASGALLERIDTAEAAVTLTEVDTIGCVKQHVPAHCRRWLHALPTPATVAAVQSALPGHFGTAAHALLTEPFLKQHLLAYLTRRPRAPSTATVPSFADDGAVRMYSSYAQKQLGAMSGWMLALAALAEHQDTGSVTERTTARLRAALDVEMQTGWGYRPWTGG